MRDMTQRQFREALVRYGMREAGFMGYVNVNVPGHHLEVSKMNAGSNRRAQLAYLLARREEQMRECDCGHMVIDHYYPVRDPQTNKLTHTACCRCDCGKQPPKPEQGDVVHD